MFHNRCHSCGTLGKIWRKNPEVFFCPNCSAFFSKFGFVIHADDEQEIEDMWS